MPVIGYMERTESYIPIDHSCGTITGTRYIADCPFNMINHNHINEIQTFKIVRNYLRESQFINESIMIPMQPVYMNQQYDQTTPEYYYCEIFENIRAHMLMKLDAVVNNRMVSMDCLTVSDHCGNISHVFGTRLYHYPPCMFTKSLNYSKNFQFIYNRHGLIPRTTMVIYPQRHEAFYQAEPVLIVVPNMGGVRQEGNTFSFDLARGLELVYPVATCYPSLVHLYRGFIQFIREDDDIFTLRVTREDGIEDTDQVMSTV